MAYFNEHLARHDTGVLINRSLVVAEDAKPANIEPVEIVENGNFRIARHLAVEKTRFINVLAQFPATALWLLSKYEQDAAKDEQDDDESVGSEQRAALNALKLHFLKAGKSFSRQKTHGDNFLTDKRCLAEAVQTFSFSFEDLTELADLIVYAYKARGFLYQASTTHAKKDAELVVKRLEGLKLRSKAKLPDMIDALQNKQFDEQFLFLTGNDMHTYFTEMVFAEHNWLESRQKLAAANSRLVLFIANQYKGGFLDFDDLVQEGQTGLLKAVDRFNYQLGFQFSTYAGYWIRQAISRALTRCERVVRLPFGQMATINKVFRGKEELMARIGKEPTRTELAEHVGISVDELNTILSISQTSMSFDAEDDEEDVSQAPANFIEQGVFTHSFGEIAASELEKLLNGAISTLNSREAKIVCSHFGINSDCEMTLQEIGAELNLTRERVRQIQVMALNKIKLNYGEQLMSFL
ncbi:MAG: RNA polymerase sigma factor RpoD/SigA [Methylococcales bacterium]